MITAAHPHRTEETMTYEMSDGERDARNAWMRGIDWCVMKVGRKWRAHPGCGDLPLFTTKGAAYEAVTAFVLERERKRAESRA
jgi:hypothetical protein